jgi:general secretion pathway protein L
LTTLFIRYPAKASIDSGAAQACPFALVGDGGNVLQQGASPLGSLADMVASARRVTLLLAAPDVTLLRVSVPPLSPARLKAALPALVEEHILGDPADCVLAVGPALDGGAERTVAVAQRAWLEVLVKALQAQGAHSISLLPAQLCLPLQPGAVSAALSTNDGGCELTLRQSQTDGLGLALPAQPETVLQTLRALAGDSPVTLYLPAAELRRYEALAAAQPAGQPAITLQEDQWPHWIAAARTAAPDLAVAVGAGGLSARQWQRWRWPLRLAVLALAVNVAGMNIEWLRLRREAGQLHQSIQQIFKSAYPNETMLDPVAQMRQHIAAASADNGALAGDEFGALSAAFGEALGSLPNKNIVATLEYRERALQVKIKPNMVDAAAMGQIRAALAARKLDLSEAAPGVWKIRVGTGSKA